MKIGKVGQVVVFVSDMKRALKFYDEMLGIKPRFTSNQWSELATEGVVIGLHVSDVSPLERAKWKSTKPSFEVDSLKENVEELRAKGVHILREPSQIGKGAWVADIADSEGNPLTLAQHSV